MESDYSSFIWVCVFSHGILSPSLRLQVLLEPDAMKLSLENRKLCAGY